MKKKKIYRKEPDVNTEGLKTGGASNKFWKILSRHILNKDYEAE